MISDRALALGAFAFMAVEMACFPVVWWLWPRNASLPTLKVDGEMTVVSRDGPVLPPPEMVRCETCGRKYILGGRHQINNCTGPKPSDSQFSAKRRRW